MCRSLKRSTYAAVKILVELCSQLKAVNAKSAEINTHLSYCIFDFFYILKARRQKAADLRLTSFYNLAQKTNTQTTQYYNMLFIANASF